MHWLYLHFPSLQLDQAERLLADQSEPLVVINTTDNTVCQLSASARTYGIKPGMGLAEVTSIYAGCRILDYSAQSEASLLEHLATTLYHIASDIVCFPTNGIAINLTPLALYYQGLENFLALCQRTLRQQHVHFHFGSGVTIDIARVLARSEVNRLYLPPETAKDQLALCSLHTTQLTHKHTEQLNRMGFRTLQQLLHLPLDEIGKRFSNEVITYLLSLKGVKQPPYTLFHPGRVFHQFLELPFAVESAMSLSRYLAIPLTHCCQYLKQRNLATDILHFTLHQREHPRLKFEVLAGMAHHHKDEWQMLVELKLEKLKPDSPVTSVELTCHQLSEYSPENLSLLESSYSRHAENLLLGKLLARLGADSVKSLQMVNDHRQDYTVKTQAPGPDNGDLSRINGQQPAWLLYTPQTLTDSTQILYGPERVHTGWWDDNPVKRDYFIARTDSGQRVWVFRDEHQSWYVHGYFA